MFVKLVVFFCHFANNDEPLPGFDGSNLSEQILIRVLHLLNSEVPDHGKHLPHYFGLFSMYDGLGIQEKHQLLKVGCWPSFEWAKFNDSLIWISLYS